MRSKLDSLLQLVFDVLDGSSAVPGQEFSKCVHLLFEYEYIYF
ncbi:MAG: hypothetical protein PUC18_13040 [Prevotellaceae bacterium]|nr:hypothetical protein [Prevotellaceae bacterium]